MTIYRIYHESSHDWQVWTLKTHTGDKTDFVRSFWTKRQAQEWIGKQP